MALYKVTDKTVVSVEFVDDTVAVLTEKTCITHTGQPQEAVDEFESAVVRNVENGDANIQDAYMKFILG